MADRHRKDPMSFKLINGVGNPEQTGNLITLEVKKTIRMRIII